MNPEPELDKRRSPLPWSMAEIGRNDVNQPVMVIRDANGHSVAEYISYGDACLIVEAVNKAPTYIVAGRGQIVQSESLQEANSP